MEKVIVPAGTKVKLSEVIDDLQSNVITNLRRRFNQLIGTYGINATLANGTVTSNDFGVSQTADTTLTIQPGEGLTPSMNFLQAASPTNLSLSSTSSGLYTVIVKSVPTFDTPTTIVNGFLYDPSGGNTANTREHAGTSFVIEDFPYTTTTSGLYLANLTWNGTDTATLTDRRDENILTLSSNILSSAFSDPSTVNLAGVKNTSFKVGVGVLNGGLGVNLATEGFTPTAPHNFRISDVNPYDEDHNAKISKVEVKWNWIGLKGTAGTDTLVVSSVIAGEDALDVAENELSGYIIFCPNFASSDNTYTCTGNTATASGSTTLTLVGIAGGEDPDESYPAEVRCTGTGFTLKLIPFKDAALKHDEARFHFLDNFYNTTQKYTLDMPLESTWQLNMDSSQGALSSGFVTMVSGIYQADSGPTGYDSPFYNILPFIDETDAGLTVGITNFGWDARVTGWQVGGESSNHAQKYEFGWTTGATLNWDDTSETATHLQIQNLVNFSSNRARTYIVGVRPIQNQQVVGTAITKTVNSGGGGVKPGDVSDNYSVNIKTWSSGTSLSGVSLASPRDTENWYGFAEEYDVFTPNGGSKYRSVAVCNNYLDNAVHGGIYLQDSEGDEFRIISTLVEGSPNKLYLELQGNPVTETAATINTGILGRRVYFDNVVSIETEGIVAEFDAELIQGTGPTDTGKIRLYQNTADGRLAADILPVHSITGYNFPIDYTIVDSQGTLSFGIDCWDPAISDENNDANIKGNLTIWTRPYTPILGEVV